MPDPALAAVIHKENKHDVKSYKKVEVVFCIINYTLSSYGKDFFMILKNNTRV